MTLLSCYYPDFEISSSCEIPNHLRDLLHEIWQHHYEELYDEDADGTITLEDAIEDVLDALWSEDDGLGHSRYVFMALILALAVSPTVEAYLPDDKRPIIILILIANWLSQVMKSSIWDNYAITSIHTLQAPIKLLEEAKITDNKELYFTLKCLEELSLAESKKSSISNINNQLFPQVSVGTQAIDEALDVFRNALRVLERSQAREALLEILDDCFEGYAIFPGSQGKRDLFNWWLLEVLPATWCLEFPDVLYTMNGLQKVN